MKKTPEYTRQCAQQQAHAQIAGYRAAARASSAGRAAIAKEELDSVTEPMTRRGDVAGTEIYNAPPKACA